MNMFEKGPINTAVASLFHDANTGLAGMLMMIQRLNKRFNQYDEVDKETGNQDALDETHYMRSLVNQIYAERKVIMDALDGFYKEFQADFPDRFKKEIE